MQTSDLLLSPLVLTATVAEEEVLVAEFPVLLEANAGADSSASVIYRLAGELAPVLAVGVSQRRVFFEQHIPFWKYPDMQTLRTSP
ncbi:hypothetical protein [Caulobacter sp. S45]|uniref:hypothetical protein n=1 Tax=Caulobacter sp. S45 TaxID=1641861 RepID=UPI00131D45BB|nr:hypothetical protein [Caulobacter sp. S45]